MSDKNKMSKIGKIISSCTLVLGGGLVLGGIFLSKKYKKYYEFKEICDKIKKELLG